MNKLAAIVGMIVLLIVLIAIGPIVVIWALNTLFPILAIQFTFFTWLAVVVLGAFLRANVSIKKD
jgi:ABC-type polysaccharide/polyol phosphate export permease